MILRSILLVAALCLTISLVKTESFPLSKLAELDEDNWRSMLDGEWMVEFFAPWCPACKTLAPTWEKFAISSGDYGVHVGRIDVTKSPSLSGRFFVVALPTIYHVIDGEFRQYRGPRDGDSLTLYVKEKQWKQTEPLSAWKRPNSIHMSLLSYFFKLSHYLKDLNTRLQDEYGLPTWGSYALFAIGTIFIGALLGLLLVCVVDFLYPPKKTQRQTFAEAKEKEKKSSRAEELPADELEDDEAEEEEDEHSTSEAEKNSNSDSDSQEISKNITEEESKDTKDIKRSDEPVQNKIDDNDEQITEDAIKNDDNEMGKQSSPEIRKRKPRKE